MATGRCRPGRRKTATGIGLLGISAAQTVVGIWLKDTTEAVVAVFTGGIQTLDLSS
ncbi:MULTISPECIES: hypothetical protein [unclassified Mesorhizobium]|uniref:hypothetical protein n=1 Tax=unclassified Mesorhizobium TaxID=325217 RepID=UPI0016778A99|nr:MULTISPECIES: hypothetical protein [unclassified Mesorhizobium]